MSRQASAHKPCVVCGVNPKVLKPNGRVRSGKCRPCTNAYARMLRNKYIAKNGQRKKKLVTHCVTCKTETKNISQYCTPCAKKHTDNWKKKIIQKGMRNSNEEAQKKQEFYLQMGTFVIGWQKV